ncbi:MAG: hypothetical protein OEO79_05665 [Gemmatimonadota bacterium]|nr:hypothetical protein [Gemmatimonadota bacterium]MDH3421763.1 hypothetical protein [Gemmatimonadota bacterium]
MIFRRYGTSYQSVDVNFDSLALNEISFRRNREEAIPADDFDASFATVVTHELTAEAEGDVQDHTEQVLLQRLQAKLEELQGALAEGQLLVVENDQGHDWPKTKQKMKNVVVEGENRLRFHYTLAPPLRVSVRRRP